MKTNLIEAGKTYRNKTGNTQRKVLSIGEGRPHWYSSSPRPEGVPAVYFERVKGIYKGTADCMYLTSFAAWAHDVVDEP